MATVEYRCKKCGATFIDDDKTTTHFLIVDEDGQEKGDCGGEGEVMYTFPGNFRSFSFRPRKVI